MSKTKNNLKNVNDSFPPKDEDGDFVDANGEKVKLPPIVVKTEDESKLNLQVHGKAIQIFGTRYRGLIEEICGLLGKAVAPLQNGQISDEGLRKTNAGLAFITSTDPQDSVELLLVSQMFAVHELAMVMSSRALASDQTFDGVERNINRVTKLMRTYTTQAEALNKYRNKGRQKITVQHVNVNDGGQAVVGDINQGRGNG
jgi:hypothetical protein